MWLSKRLAWYIYLGLKIRVIVTNSHHNDGKMIFFFRLYHSIFCRILHNITTVYAIQEALKHCTSRKVIIVFVMRFENYVSDMHKMCIIIIIYTRLLFLNYLLWCTSINMILISKSNNYLEFLIKICINQPHKKYSLLHSITIKRCKHIMFRLSGCHVAQITFCELWVALL